MKIIKRSGEEKIFDINKISHIDHVITNNNDNNIDEVTKQVYNLYMSK